MKRVIDELEFGLVGHYSESVRIRGKWYDRHDVVELYRTLTQPITGAECVILLSKYTAFFNGTRKKIKAGRKYFTLQECVDICSVLNMDLNEYLKEDGAPFSLERKEYNKCLKDTKTLNL